MSYSTFEDFDEKASDIFTEDFDNKVSLKIKSCGPCTTTVTTNTSYDPKTSVLVPKISLKWPHPSGFTLDKFELSSACRLTLESSLTGLAPGLKLEFKGNDSEKADLSATYNHAAATFTAEFDINKLESAKASVNGGNGNITAGASVDFKIAKAAVDSTNFEVGVGYTIPKQAFVSFRAGKNFSNFSSLLTYNANKDTVLAAKVNHSTGSSSTCADVAVGYKCNPETYIKVKVSTGGVFSASVKQACDKKFTVVGSAEVPSDFNSFKWGVNATLG